MALVPTLDGISFKDAEVKTYRVDAYCKCGGKLKNMGHGITTLKTDWLHRCRDCGMEYWLDRTYPAIEYRSDD